MSAAAKGWHTSFEPGEDTEYFVATFTVRIATKEGRHRRGFGSDGVEVIMDRVIGAAAGVYSWHSAQVESVKLESVVPEAVS